MSNENTALESNLILICDEMTSEIHFTVDTKEDDWKYNQSTNIIDKANELMAQGVPLTILENIVSDINNNLDYLTSENDKLNSLTLFSSLYYNKAILNTAIRATVNNEKCNCTTHPEFLSDISNFKCQEDHYYLVSALKDILSEYQEEEAEQLGEVDENFKNLFYYIKGYQGGSYVSFKEYFEVYTGEEFPAVEYAKWCPFGKGSDHGCFGNYEGCCWFWSVNWLVHDVMCLNCRPRWFCLPGCKPGYVQPKPEPAFNGYNYDNLIATDWLIEKPLQVERYIRE